jgi:hypothetical protein
VKKSHFHPHPGPPLEGEGISFCISICFPSPLEGEGRVRGKIPNFSHLQGMKGRGMDKAMKFFYSSPPPKPSPIKGEGVFLTFYEIIKFAISGREILNFPHPKKRLRPMRSQRGWAADKP